ncbi:MAG: CapA family protein [Blautia sp.]
MFAIGAAGAALLLILVIVIAIITNKKNPDQPVLTDDLASSDTDLQTNAAETGNEAADVYRAITEPVTLTVSAAGDCTLGTDEEFDYSTSLNAYYETKGSQYFFQNVLPIFSADDLTIVNMEGTLTDSEEREDKQFAFKADASYADILKDGSVEAANLANNHSHDYGDQSYEDTKAALDAAGITHFGYEETAMMDIKGIKVGLVGIYELKDHLEREQQLRDNIAKVKEDGAQLVIVTFHWGNEKETVPDSNQTQLGHVAIDAGADLVVGHHPHVLQGIEKYKDRFIVYSLGNFCFGGNAYPSDLDTMIYQQTFTISSDGVAKDDAIRLIPCAISGAYDYNDYQPALCEGEEKQRILDKIQALCGEISDSMDFYFQ